MSDSRSKDRNLELPPDPTTVIEIRRQLLYAPGRAIAALYSIRENILSPASEPDDALCNTMRHLENAGDICLSALGRSLSSYGGGSCGDLFRCQRRRW